MFTRKHSSSFPYAGGFTLIELLVVVAIIALLISILLPSLSRARDTAKTVACASVLKQFGTANYLYADDSDDQFVPIIMGYAGGSSVPHRWYNNDLFLSSLGVAPGEFMPDGLFCPSRQDPSGLADNREYSDLNHSYAFNWYGLENTYPRDLSVHRTSVQSPSARLQMIDNNDFQNNGHWTWANYEQYWDVTGEANLLEGGSYWVTAYRHNEGANILHFDSHVSYYAKQEAYPDDEGEREKLWRVYDEN